MNPHIREHARRGKRASGARRLTLAKVEAELPRLDSLEMAMARLDRVGLWAAAGVLHGSAASAVVRSVEVWVRAHESTLTRDVIDQLRARLDELEGQIRRAKGGVAAA